MIDVARAVFSQSEYRKTADVVRQSVMDRDSLSSELTFRTLFEKEADANAFLREALDLRSPGRRDWKLSIPTATALSVKIGSTITVTHPRFGLREGKDFIVKGVKLDLGSPMSGLTLYGPR